MRTNSRLAASLREDHALEQEKRIGTLTEERIAGAWGSSAIGVLRAFLRRYALRRDPLLPPSPYSARLAAARSK